MAVQFWEGDVLFDNGAVAMHPDCCCGGIVKLTDCCGCCHWYQEDGSSCLSRDAWMSGSVTIPTSSFQRLADENYWADGKLGYLYGFVESAFNGATFTLDRMFFCACGYFVQYLGSYNWDLEGWWFDEPTGSRHVFAVVWTNDEPCLEIVVSRSSDLCTGPMVGRVICSAIFAGGEWHSTRCGVSSPHLALIYSWGTGRYDLEGAYDAGEYEADIKDNHCCEDAQGGCHFDVSGSTDFCGDGEDGTCGEEVPPNYFYADNPELQEHIGDAIAMTDADGVTLCWYVSDQSGANPVTLSQAMIDSIVAYEECVDCCGAI